MKTLIIISLCLSSLVVNVFAQEKIKEKVVEKNEKKVIKKANERPGRNAKKKEPYDDVDVKTMATKCVLLETEKGNIKLEMYPESAPETVRNFLNLVAIGALDTTTFSRVVPDFVIQGGNLYTSEKLTDALRWRAIENIPDEPNQIRHEKGIISMARDVEKPNSASTNFFILLSSSSYLDGKFAAFGKVIEGIETAETINKMDVVEEAPKKPVRINTATIETCPDPEAMPKTKETPEVKLNTEETPKDSDQN